MFLAARRRPVRVIHGKLPVCTVGLWCDAFHGEVTLHVDTPEHSAAFLAKQLKSEFPWFGQDAQGTFCKVCWDMEHCIGEFRHTARFRTSSTNSVWREAMEIAVATHPQRAMRCDFVDVSCAVRILGL